MAPGVSPAKANHDAGREDALEPFFDRWFANLGYYWHNAFRRRREVPTAFVTEVARHARGAGGAPCLLPDLRYRLRRDGLQPPLIAECFGLYCATIAGLRADAPAPEAMGAAVALLEGNVAELGSASARRHALGLAATTWAVCGVHVHWVCGSDARSQAAALALQATLAALGLSSALILQGMGVAARRTAYSAPIVFGSLREIAADYLRHRILLGGHRPLTGTLRQLAGDAGGEPVMRGLHCALVEEADELLLDDAHMPLVLAKEAEQPLQRFVYEQALELAQALAKGVDFSVEDGRARLTEVGSRRAGRLAAPLMGIWGAREEREELLGLALDALHCYMRDVDYKVDQGRVTLVRPAGETGERGEAEETVQRLVEVKEGCRLGLRPEVQARLSVPRFLRRYPHLAGTCADARGAVGEFWSLYRLKTALAGASAPATDCIPRMFLTAMAKRQAVVERARVIRANGGSVLIAVRTPAETKELFGILGEAGMPADVLQGAGSTREQEALERLARPGGVSIALYPAGREVGERAGIAAPITVLVAELHDARRHVDRICRAFGTGSCEVLLSLDDDRMRALLGGPVSRWAFRSRDGELSLGRSRWLVRHAQRSAERAGAMMRQEMMWRDRQLDDLLAFSGKFE